MLVELGLADAYGIGFEFVDRKGDSRPVTGDCFYQNPNYDTLVPGQYTDDTQRSIANAAVVLDFDPLSIESYAYMYVGVYLDDPRDGYSRNYQAFLDSCSTSQDFIEKVKRTAVSNGSIMGVLPLGYLPNPGVIKAAAAAQAMTTHSYETVPYAQSLALAAHYFLTGDSDCYFGGMLNYLEDNMDWSNDRIMDWKRPSRRGPVKMTAYDTWSAVMTLQAKTSLHDILISAVNLRGDTDSVAALAVGLASLNPQIRKDLPEALYDNFERGPFGIDLLRDYDARLLKKLHNR
jgi:ADP-ribosyl-[dinitrogen reductase] hydrolase